MSYDELGGMLEAGPSVLYDALARALGMEQITDAIKELDSRAKVLKAPGAELNTRRKALQQEASQIAEERADQVAALLKKSKPDTTTLRGLATGITVIDQGPIARLRTLESLTAPSFDHVQAAAEELAGAVSGMADAGEAELARSAARLEMRRQALHLHDQFGDMTCPVCAAGRLDDEWAASSRDLVQARQAELKGLTLARDRLERARRRARDLVQPRPAALNPTPDDALLEEQVRVSREAWDTWAAVPESDLDLVEHLRSSTQSLHSALVALRHAAATEFQARQDLWGPLATKVSAFCDNWDAWQSQEPRAIEVANALKWLKTNDVQLRNERLEPIADEARAAWSLLRQESNVELGTLELEGTATRRRVNISADVDGADAGALAVMSQGELHALSLALFLPRAAMPDSPFRFVVLDDPVQAMDPAKVEGLVQLLSEMAETRQVVVLSHDDRLPAAVRRAKIGARILEVERGTDSSVQISVSVDPTERYLADARALLLDADLPEVTIRRTLPGLLRLAVESCAQEIVFERRLTRGDLLADVESVWSTHHATRERVSLALYDEVRPLDAWLVRGYRKFGLGLISSAMHQGLKEETDPRSAVDAVIDVVKDLREGNKQ